MNPVLEPRRLPDEVCALSHPLPEVSDVPGRDPGPRDEVGSQQLSQRLGVDLVRLDLGFGYRSHLQRMSELHLEAFLLDSFVDELPDARGLKDELGIPEPVQEPIELFVRGRALSDFGSSKGRTDELPEYEPEHDEGERRCEGAHNPVPLSLGVRPPCAAQQVVYCVLEKIASI